MQAGQAVTMMSALAQETRLAAFRLLLEHEPEGLQAGRLAKGVGALKNTLSTHLAILQRAGLVSSIRSGRQIIYRANVSELQNLLTYLIEDCCRGQPERRTPLLQNILGCCDGGSEKAPL
jgi:DNA-binding transcriptional ArsR family regulator